MKYKCLVLDHDDTVVDSTATIHYPSFVAYLEEKMPERLGDYNLEIFFKKNFDPGVIALFRDELGMSDEEMEHEEKYWIEFVEKRIPHAYEGMAEIIADFRRQGGIIAVVSHSFQRYIERDYKHNSLPMPDIIYGWDIPKENRKPSPWCILDLAEKYGIEPSEILVVDDLKPGYDMARAAGAHFAAAGWANDIPEIEDFMRENCDYYLKTVADLKLLIGE